MTYIILVVGFENKTNEKFVTYLAIFKNFYDEVKDANFTISKGSSMRYSIVEKEQYNHEIVLNYLNRLKGGVCGFIINYLEVSEKMYNDIGYNFDELSRCVDEMNIGSELSKSLLNSVATNGIEKRVDKIVQDYISVWKESFDRANQIEGLDRFDLESLNGIDAPLVFGILYKNITPE